MRLNEFLEWRTKKLTPFAEEYSNAETELFYTKSNLKCSLDKAYDDPTNQFITETIFQLRDRYQEDYATWLLKKDAFEQAQLRFTPELCRTEKIYGGEQC